MEDGGKSGLGYIIMMTMKKNGHIYNNGLLGHVCEIFLCIDERSMDGDICEGTGCGGRCG